MIGFPNAKINLGLRILSKREDNYHNISSIFAPINLVDILEFQPSETTTFSSSGIHIPASKNGNLITQAYNLLASDFKIEPLDIRLEKTIPIGAGMGGGSADGSFMLTLLNQYYELGLTFTELENYASKLGADCPFFIQNKISHVEGIGEKMTHLNLDLSSYYLVLINPGIHVSTSEAYSNLIINDRYAPFVPKEIDNTNLNKWAELGLTNDFENSVFPIYPEIKGLKHKLEEAGALYSSMTGTGSTVYGIFKEKPEIGNLKPNQRLFFTKFI